MRRCPGVVFAEGVTGRRARIAGTGLEVWEVISAWNGMDRNWEDLKTAYDWLSEHQLKSALGYYRAYPEEIDRLIKANQSMACTGFYR
jgi:uncharacterized protein (DUF433 family)